MSTLPAGRELSQDPCGPCVPCASSLTSGSNIISVKEAKAFKACSAADLDRAIRQKAIVPKRNCNIGGVAPSASCHDAPRGPRFRRILAKTFWSEEKIQDRVGR